ncbi:FAD-dependent pyridine nucleotide-disulfide oxidoreductase [Rhizobium sp. Y9]|uniref:FAD/NAD(P)-binding protein n=1 Tax=Agrobacterium pusense TaxID=648995 RepID=UPI000C2D4FF6|nr:FAD/NAD(P)-binding protein [Agrobacterium pusense]AUC12174.1 FAD-dependent pyridine nucleotide-disulfide oxidoreductase [Rhizobium sp. Y9]MCZ7930419.1 FAD/NAD(P)-binding domain-containing protein [Agrobacterium pusense]MDP9772163.1 putative NAD(P)/FAD-binding protein YdhS [Rhizobium sp. SORGH_AS_0755]
MSYDVALVGSGFSAICTAAHLLSSLPAEASIAIVGDESDFGRGTAYRTELPYHRLNVPAGRMSVFPDRPDDFVEWLAQNGLGNDPLLFASRGDYGLYLRDRLASLLRSREQRARVDFIRAKASACRPESQGGFTFTLENGETLQARNVVLCLGVGAASLPVQTAAKREEGVQRVVSHCWQPGWLSRVKSGDRICILGSGLTMIDQVLTLRGKGHRGPIHVLSRRGLIPHPHVSPPVPPSAPRLPEGSTEISELLRSLRQQVTNGAPWRSVMDGLRPKTQSLWQSLSSQQRARFLRHALPWWNIHRHRIAPEVHDAFDRLLSDGVLTIHAGYLQAIDEQEESISIRHRVRHTQMIKELQVDWVINCTGMERAGIGHSRLLESMRSDGVLRLDSFGLGVEVDGDSRLLRTDGQAWPGLFAVGALTAGRFWEITAVPDIRIQARDIAHFITDRVIGKRLISAQG